MSNAKTDKPKNNRRDIELPPNTKTEVAVEPEELSPAEQMLERLRPYFGQIVLGVLVFMAGYFLLSYFIVSNRESAAEQWRQLSDAQTIFRTNGNVDSLKQMSVDFPNEKATNWALMLAGDHELGRGIQQLTVDREAGLKLIEKGKESFKKIVDAPASSKTTLQQRRALNALAYANESMGNFDEAEKLYAQLEKDAADTALGKFAKRGRLRVANPEFRKLYQVFLDHNPEDEVAPGLDVPAVPNVEFPEVSEDNGGDFKPDDQDDSKDEKDEVGETEATDDKADAADDKDE